MPSFGAEYNTILANLAALYDLRQEKIEVVKINRRIDQVGSLIRHPLVQDSTGVIHSFNTTTGTYVPVSVLPVAELPDVAHYQNGAIVSVGGVLYVKKNGAWASIGYSLAITEGVEQRPMLYISAETMPDAENYPEGTVANKNGKLYIQKEDNWSETDGLTHEIIQLVVDVNNFEDTPTISFTKPVAIGELDISWRFNRELKRAAVHAEQGLGEYARYSIIEHGNANTVFAILPLFSHVANGPLYDVVTNKMTKTLTNGIVTLSWALAALPAIFTELEGGAGASIIITAKLKVIETPTDVA